MDLLVYARDTTGLYRVLKLAKRTTAGHVIQALPLGGDSGLHRTWHRDGYVHDRSTNPPSTTSSGKIQPPQGAVDECFARYDLAAGALGQYPPISGPPGGNTVIVELTDAAPAQRLEVWYTQPASLSGLELAIRGGAAGPLTICFSDEDGGLARLVVAFVARAAA